jgi:DNA invertase Pin-like site-specific DNA recombinase
MEKQDGRKLSKTALEERRRIIIRMKENGSSPSEITAATGCSRQSIYPLWNTWKKSKSKYKDQKILAVKNAASLSDTGAPLRRHRRNRYRKK